MALLTCAYFVKAETVTMTGPNSVFDKYVDFTYGWNYDYGMLWMREYWRNDGGFGAWDCRPFIRIDLSSIPANSQIDSVTFKIRVYQTEIPYWAPMYCDLWKVSPFTNDMTALTYDGTNPWPNHADAADYSYDWVSAEVGNFDYATATAFDGIDGYMVCPNSKYLATSDAQIYTDMAWDLWLNFSGDALTQYIQTQSDQAEGARYAYFQLTTEDGDNYWVEFYGTEDTGSENYPRLEVTYSEKETQYPGDANGDGAVDVGDLGILAANYGGTEKTWAEGDFNGDGLVDVGDLGILAANYGTGSQSGADFDADYAKTFGVSSEKEEVASEEDGTACSSLGLSLVAGFAIMGLMLVKLEA
jgi:hypothetical protein